MPSQENCWYSTRALGRGVNEEYSGYRGLPMLAGLCSMEEALGDGLSVEECVKRLKECIIA